ncbi:SAM-dependent methyltransferase [Sphaerisporangium sp. TRM90804]|uniref:SAM-dependent methyltransferase n=1 Tax=Sphaerisporangium sp. TRM90804 TaxID=3031113 RepID=UPI00244D6579|nr:SAM-dependent methyltransferase [Sphaerisporangium sp. TRM90804]MDH2429094.1 SAM-dependent methyltransferase [Sphaerisporangium sp. TRM90804]
MGDELSAGRASGIDTSVPHSARIWNYWLGGKDNYPVDQAAGDEYMAIFPGVVELARASRAFLARAVRYLAADAGIRQFLDIGTGLPTVDNTHEVAQRVAPESKIVYVDNDPLVLVHAQALLTGSAPGLTAYVEADLREPEEILKAAGQTLDFRQPVALMLMGILGHIATFDEARSIVTRLVDALPSGSYLAINDGTNVSGTAIDEAQQQYNEGGAVPYQLRTPEEIGRFFEGLELVEPGLVSLTRWRPEATPFGTPAEVDGYCAVGRKP